MASERFGASFPEVCKVCHQAELEILSRPHGHEEHMVRGMPVATSCNRCSWVGATSWRIKTVTVYLPTSVIADATSFAKKHQASLSWGLKPSCADLQLVNLACAERDPALRRAYLTVGFDAIVEELTFSYNRLYDFALELVCGMDRRPTAWRAVPSPGVSQGASVSTADTGAPDEGGDTSMLGGLVAAVGSWVNAYPGEDGATEPSRDSKLERALTATVVEEQQRAYVEGGLLNSTTTTTRERLARTDSSFVGGYSGAGDESSLPADHAGGLASGDRTARARFPKLSETQNYLHSNNPQNLQAAHDLRNVGIGHHNPFVSEAKTRDLLVAEMKDRLFTPANVKQALRGFESIRQTALPKKLTKEAAHNVELEAMNAVLNHEVVGFDTVVKAFVKSEVTAKDKPRPIANHGETRLYALSKIAYVFEHVMFNKLNSASIKERPKKQAIEEILRNMDKMHSGKFVENDLTAFEFGISETLKRIEQDVLRHIARLVGVEDCGELLFDKVVEDRDKCVTWRMTYRDETGERKTAKIRIAQTMRESGDRITSSGNFFQNLVAWFSYLVDPEYVKDAFENLLKFKGAKMFYVSPRDRSTVMRSGKEVRVKYLTCFAFEGDDTAARFDEKIWPEEGQPCPVAAFFERWGWRAKLVWKPLLGDSYVRFVGYEALICDSKLVYDGAEIVMTPETKRFLKTKSDTTTAVTPQELKTCIRIFAATLAEGYKRVEPMHSFLQAMYDDNEGGLDVSGEAVREYYLSTHGVLPEAGLKVSASIPMPDFEGGDASKWKRLLRVAAGDFDDREWATMCHVGTMQMHGEDLATCVPASWRA